MKAEDSKAADDMLSLWRQSASGVAMVKVESCVLCQNISSQSNYVFPSFATCMQSSVRFLHYICFSIHRNDNHLKTERVGKNSIQVYFCIFCYLRSFFTPKDKDI